MGNQYKQRIYKCKCGVLTKQYVWDNELDKIKIICLECSSKLDSSNLLKSNISNIVSIRTPTKNR